MLGAVHFKSPRIPFMLSWPSNDEAVKYLTKAFNTGIATHVQIVYLAQALKKDGQDKKAHDLLHKLITAPLSSEYGVEDAEQRQIAKELIADWE